MIAVIADDFTGAAEIGGIGLRHGLKVLIQTEPINHPDTDLLVIATDTRSMSVYDARTQILSVTRKLLELNPDFVFKKIDSVLRGNVLPELVAQMEVTGMDRAIIVAANPVFHRLIREGRYSINGIPLHKTRFSSDPQFPIKSDSVFDILNPHLEFPLVNLNPDDELPPSGLIIGDVSNIIELDKWAALGDEKTQMAGASGFFNALLNRMGIPVKIRIQPVPSFGEKAFYVLGSTYDKDLDFLRKMDGNGSYISNIPEEIYYNKSYDEKYLDLWVNDIVDGFNQNNHVSASIIHNPGKELNIADRLREVVGELVKRVVDRVNLQELLIEGGSTTSYVLKYLGIKKLIPVHEMDMGVIRMKTEEIPGMFITTKPGSYIWPNEVLESQKNGKPNHVSVDLQNDKTTL